jgi:hypothetical protein
VDVTYPSRYYIALRRSKVNKPRTAGKSKHVILNENCTILGYYAATNGNFVPTFRDNLSVLHPLLVLEDGIDRLSKMSVRNYHYSLCNNTEEHVSHLFHDRNLKSHIILKIPQKLVIIRRLEIDEDLSIVIASYSMES